jgi:hypothetical protein
MDNVNILEHTNSVAHTRLTQRIKEHSEKSVKPIIGTSSNATPVTPFRTPSFRRGDTPLGVRHLKCKKSINLHTTMYLVSTVLYVDEWCQADFRSVCITRQTYVSYQRCSSLQCKLSLTLAVGATETCRS